MRTRMLARLLHLHACGLRHLAEPGHGVAIERNHSGSTLIIGPAGIAAATINDLRESERSRVAYQFGFVGMPEAMVLPGPQHHGKP